MKNNAQTLPPLLRLGFRPFFLCASLSAVLSMLLWMLNRFGLSGNLIGGLDMPPLLWHGHEMIFGFVFAVIAGFLLTASSNWTGFNPAKGILLAILVFCWLGARVFFYAGSLYPAAILDIGFDILLLFAVARVILKARMWRNLIVVFLLSLPAFLNLDFYLIEIFRLSLDPVIPLEGALAVFFFFVLLIAGRIIPVFTPNAIKELTLEPTPLLNKLSLLSGFTALLLWSLSAQNFSAFMEIICPVLFCIAALFNGLRFFYWKPLQVLKNGMISALYFSYFWVILSFLCMVLESLDLAPRTMTLHLMAIGGISMAIAAMLCRVSLGHTGRKILAGKTELFFFFMVFLACIFRLVAAIPSVISHQIFFMDLLFASASCFTLGFAAFFCRYAPYLCTNRPDGKNG